MTKVSDAPKCPTVTKAPARDLPGCNCKLDKKPWTYSVQFWHIKVEYQEQDYERHKQGCKYFGIRRQTKSRTKGQIRLRVGWLSSLIILACMEYSHGTASPGLTIRYQNVVRQKYSPVFHELSKLHFSYLFRDSELSDSEIVLWFEGAERAILSLYRDRKASPSDRDEYGTSHTGASVSKALP